MVTYSANVDRPYRDPNPPKVKPKPKPDGWHPGEEKFGVWRMDWAGVWTRDPDTVRNYMVYGITNWQKGPRAQKAYLARNFTLALIERDGKMTAKARVELARHQVIEAVGIDPKQAVYLDVDLSTPAEDKELRKVARYVLRLAVWASKRVGAGLEQYLEDLVAEQTNGHWFGRPPRGPFFADDVD